MDDHRVDALTRSLSSRRTALGGLLGGGLAALLDLPAPKEAAAHDFRDRRRIEDPPRRRACLRRARAHNCKHRQSTPPPCVPQLLAITCAPGCGLRGAPQQLRAGHRLLLSARQGLHRQWELRAKLPRLWSARLSARLPVLRAGGWDRRELLHADARLFRPAAGDV